MTTSSSPQPRAIELLAPARDLECGLAAIEHGADAVYIGAGRFGARAAAGNTIDDIGRLCDRAHVFGARVYATVNTIVYEHELEAAQRLLDQLAAVGVDAVLVQDMALVGQSPLPLHASTQTDNRSAEKVEWLRELGFSRVVLARELSLDEIATIHQAVPDVELEVFVHGALCVSYSGLCYASHHCFGRSANRGECAQFCRLKFDLHDADGRAIVRGRHLLSLKDLCRLDYLEELLLAGATSLKIEGRLKDAAYVKNVVAAYSQRLDAIVARHPNRYRRASAGRCTYRFEPDVHKTFSRGFTTYFLHGRQSGIASPDTPKAMGPSVGTVKRIEPGNHHRAPSVTVAGTTRFANGDGLCFLNADRELEGFRVNRVENNRLFLQHLPPTLRPGMVLRRNNDQEFERLLAHDSAERKLEVDLRLEAADGQLVLQLLSVDGGLLASASQPFSPQAAQQPQRDNVERQLRKLGNTPFVCRRVEIDAHADGLFFPSSLLSRLRQSVVAAALQSVPVSEDGARPSLPKAEATWAADYAAHPYQLNVANSQAESLYRRCGLAEVQPAFELQSHQQPSALLMQCRHCLRFELGHCVKHGGTAAPWREPLSLVLADGRRFRLAFDCKKCQMNVYAAE